MHSRLLMLDLAVIDDRPADAAVKRGERPLAHNSLYDPATDTWSAGRVLAAGVSDEVRVVLDDVVEVFQP